MKIAILVDPVLRPSILSEETLEAIRALGEVTLNTTGAMDDDSIQALIQGADIAITSWGNQRLDANLLDAAPDLRLVVHAAGSVKGIVSDALYARGIRVASCARVLSEGVSEMALGLTLATAKNMFAFNQQLHEGGWVQDYTVVSEMYGLRVGIVGFGFAGAHYAELLQAFEVEVVVYDPFADPERVQKAGASLCDLDTLLKTSDIISLHAPSIDSTHHMINADTIAKMKDGVILINTARGSLIDEAALAQALRAGKFKYVCLDVFDPEPPAGDSPLRSIPNCILTPHVAGLANNGKLRIGAFTLGEIRHFAAGEPLKGEVTQAMLATMA